MTPIEAITAKLRIALNGRAQSVTCGPALCRAGQRVGNEIDAATARNRSRHRQPPLIHTQHGIDMSGITTSERRDFKELL